MLDDGRDCWEARQQRNPKLDSRGTTVYPFAFFISITDIRTVDFVIFSRERLSRETYAELEDIFEHYLTSRNQSPQHFREIII